MSGTPGCEDPRDDPPVSAAEAKARLLRWAEECDGRGEAWLSVGTIASAGLLAMVGGMVIARVLVVPRRGESEARAVHRLDHALLASVGQWLLPLAIGAVQHGRDHRARREADGPGPERA